MIVHQRPHHVNATAPCPIERGHISEPRVTDATMVVALMAVIAVVSMCQRCEGVVFVRMK